MPRSFTVAAAQLGPIAWDEPRSSAVTRMIALMTRAAEHGAKLDLDRCREIQDNIFSFAAHRQPDQYGLLTDPS